MPGRDNALFVSCNNELSVLESGVAARLHSTATSVLFGGIYDPGMYFHHLLQNPRFVGGEIDGEVKY